MARTSEWDRWEARWRAVQTSPAELEALIGRMRRARRAAGLVRLASAGLAVFAIAVVGAALRHAGNPLEITLGGVVAAGIAAVWILDLLNNRDEVRSVDAVENEYREARRALCRRQDRFARLGWMVVALDLVFLIPWWIGGIAVHGAGVRPQQILATWIPLVAMVAFVGWTLVLRRHAQAELREIDRASPSRTEEAVTRED